jgi:spore coat polysaccharide biosynthesis predicted glycosyltransferase SpsG
MHPSRTCQKMISGDKSLTECQERQEFLGRDSLWICTGSGPQMGFGHLRRTIILAQSLSDCCDPLFLIAPLDFSSRRQLTALGFRYCTYDVDRIWSDLKRPAAILIDTRNPNGLDRFIKSAKDHKIPVTSIHDLGLNPLSSDVLIDGSIAPELKIPKDSVFYRGLSYMVLGPEFEFLRQKQKTIRENIESVFINFGGGDSKKYYRRALEGLKCWGRALKVAGAPGYVSWGQEDIEKMDWRPIDFHWEQGSIAPVLFHSDLAITAGGLSAYESLCCGTPLMALSYDAYQQSAIEKLADADACIDLGPGEILDPALLPEKIAILESSLEKRISLSQRGRRLVDGLGLQRVSGIIRNLISNCSREL